jgi:5-methylcytosine-specific restriction protein A
LAVPKLRPRRAQLPKLLPADDSVYATHRWKQLSRMVRRQRPVCEVCGNDLATQVHHIVPLRQAPQLAYEPTNLQSLCNACHAAKHGVTQQPIH